MSIEAYRKVWSIKMNGMTTNLRCTLLAIAEFASEFNDYTCSASVATIADALDVRPRQAQRNLSDLERLGLIVILPGCGRGNTNIYSMKHVMDDVLYDPKGCHVGQENTSSMTYFNEERVSSETEKVSCRAIKGVMDDTQTNNSNNNKPLLLFGSEEKGDDGPVQQLSDHFTRVTGIMPNGGVYQDKWQTPLEIILDRSGSVDVACRKIDAAWQIAKNPTQGGKRYNPTSPRGLMTIIANLPEDEIGDGVVRVKAR